MRQTCCSVEHAEGDEFLVSPITLGNENFVDFLATRYIQANLLLAEISVNYSESVAGTLS